MVGKALKFTTGKQDPHSGGSLAADYATQWFNILRSIDYNYIFPCLSVHLLLTSGMG